MALDYKKEFFDRDYTVGEAYSRAWGYARKYKFRIFVGVVCGMLTAGTLVPLFQVVQPALQQASANEREAEALEEARETAQATASAGAAHADGRRLSPMERKMARAAKLPGWYPKVERMAKRCGIELQDKSGAMGGALLLIAVVVIPLLAAVRLLLIFLNQYCLCWAATRAVTDLRVDLFRQIQRQSLQFHGRIDVGQLMMRAVGDPSTVQMMIQSMLSQLARAPFEILAAVAFIVYFAIDNHMLATLGMIVIGLPAFIFPVVGLGKRIRAWSRKSLEKGTVVGSHLHEVLTCVRVVKAFGTEEFENRRYESVNRRLLGTIMKAFRWGLIVGPVVETIGIVILCGFLVWCFMTRVTLANVLPMLAPLLLIYKPVKQLCSLQVSLETAQASLQRIWSLMDLDMELPESPSAAPKPSFDDRIVFDDVSFRYEGADHDAVSHASFEIRKGQTVAVVGGTGSGKSTLSGLLCRFFDPQTGRVAMDGQDLRDLRTADLRALIGSVQQETLLFNESIEANISYGSPGATHEQVVAAAKMANAHEFIMSQPEGYGRVVGEKGFSLSGGERQRIAIARAILRNPPILILDEATSALDTVTERLVQEAVNNLMANRTTFAIAHRLSTIRNSDLILVMDHGRIVERGTHEELYAAGGVYRRLCDMQTTD
ncbi:MAG: ABC transporter ATP-binding protein [Kiritimatiellae bacterium]|nr:ABC transporter ATP-binding protein [Kiritimatiellia bacterium]